MPDLPVYECPRTPATPNLDGTLTDPAWEVAPWTTDFVPIAGEGPAPRFRTRAKLMYDDQYLYVGGVLEEPHLWSTMTEKNSKLFHENNFELFLDPDGDGQNYYEFEINPLGTIWELTLPKPYVDGGVPIDPTNLPGSADRDPPRRHGQRPVRHRHRVVRGARRTVGRPGVVQRGPGDPAEPG